MTKSFNKTYKSNPENLPDIEKFVLDTIQNELKINDQKKDSIEIAIAEAAANSIIHGNHKDPNKSVSVKIVLNTKKIVISFKDEGDGFTPEKVPDPTKPENILKGSGRGIYIMKSLADDVKYKFTKKSAEVILTFNL